MTQQTAISVANLSKAYGKQPVLRDISFTVAKGSIFALLGQNGAGKTTAVRILSTLTQADSGTATVSGHDVKAAAQQVRQCISLTGQYAAVDEKLTARENMSMIAELCGVPAAAAKERTNYLFEQFELAKASDKIASTLSGGMRRKLDLAMSLLTQPKVIFLDEPTTGLDPRSRKAMWASISSLRDEGVTIFLTTQYLEEADQLADMVAVIHGGVIVAQGTPDELKQQVGEQSLRFSFASTEECSRARTAFAVDRIMPSDETTALYIKVDGSLQQTKQTVDALAAIGSKPLETSFHKPTLDDVFFALTGNTTSKENNDAV